MHTQQHTGLRCGHRQHRPGDPDISGGDVGRRLRSQERVRGRWLAPIHSALLNEWLDREPFSSIEAGKRLEAKLEAGNRIIQPPPAIAALPRLLEPRPNPRALGFCEFCVRMVRQPGRLLLGQLQQFPVAHQAGYAKVGQPGLACPKNSPGPRSVRSSSASSNPSCVRTMAFSRSSPVERHGGRLSGCRSSWPLHGPRGRATGATGPDRTAPRARSP